MLIANVFFGSGNEEKMQHVKINIAECGHSVQLIVQHT